MNFDLDNLFTQMRRLAEIGKRSGSDQSAVERELRNAERIVKSIYPRESLGHSSWSVDNHAVRLFFQAACCAYESSTKQTISHAKKDDDLVLVPKLFRISGVHSSVQHWVLFAEYRGNVFFYNSGRGNSKIFAEWAARRFPNERFVAVKCPKQPKRSNDCGVYVCFFATCILLSRCLEEIPWDKYTVPWIRGTDSVLERVRGILLSSMQ